ncbi:UDP-N-acetylmuramate--alanine ligase [Candidatus Planktophila sulfonica]|uniref:UDP-N-acetylmuramate--L-alanine ligase n=1 Tax=Candidatus Planktophila sulfonica TaxID=1884904 RepID=A0A249KGB8_9ACTN|nr:UDP-N-acetylmuramate--L-alanine ligase [Candidatus Planktophila sulfonica]ASY15832.1 UDP-N-acetylmuramate--alanine ligase [Candidatus Planktophila sulfonica]
MNSLKGKKIHFIGIGGSGMSGLARIALSDGIAVSGSDAKDSSVLTALRALGAEVFTSHEAAHVQGADVVIYSTAISASNPEMAYAVERSIPILTRAQALAALMSGSKSIAVAGTHGKTTTSSMLTVALQACGVDPSFAIGGTLTASGSNAHRGTGDFFVAEADESDGSFVEYRPLAAIVTNIEHDHVDFFHTPEAVTEVFENFAATISPQGFLIYCADDAGATRLGTSGLTCTPISYGESESADLRIDQIELKAIGSSARVMWRGRAVGHLELQVPGHHNLLNAASCLAMGLTLELPIHQLLEGLHNFRGAGRRFELKATEHGIRIIDDYGHHPTEITVTLQAARRYAGDGRVLVIFQPHRYSRTQAFLDDFAVSLDLADDVTLLEIYAASEKPIHGVSSSLIAEKMSRGHFIPNFASASERVIEMAKPGDVIITLGAGDVNSLAPIIAEGLQRRFA